MSNFNERLTDLMNEDELTCKKLGNALNFAESIVSRWKKHGHSVKLSTAIKIADYFKVTLDYLSGRSEDDKSHDFKPCPPFSEHIKRVLKECKTTVYRLDKYSDFKDSFFYNWNRGEEPQLNTLTRLADILEISLDYLVGRL